MYQSGVSMPYVEKSANYDNLESMLADPDLKPHTCFVLEPGVYYYNQSIKIPVPGIKLKRNENIPNNHVIFICERGPLFYVSMEFEDKKLRNRKKEWATYRSLPVEFDGIYFAHVAFEGEEAMFNNEYEEDNKSEDEKSSENDDGGFQNKKWLKNEIENLLSKNHVYDSPEKNICILSYNMTISLVNCKFNLSTASSEATCVLTNGGVLEIKSCDFRGNKEHPCSGVVVFKSHMMITDSGFQYFKNQGIFCWGEYDYRVMIYDCIIRNNESRGIALVGEGFGPYIYRSTISTNTGYGIYSGIYTNPKIVLNKIEYNKQGVYSLCSDPWIFMNKIINNLYEGILFNSCDSTVRELKYVYKEDNEDYLSGFGSVKCNILNENFIGVNVNGKKLKTRISDNMHIAFNKGVGIRVSNEAEAKIKNNQVYKNEMQGILICEYAFGFVENNKVFKNQKANIALGGINSMNTTIINNYIFASDGEGIFMNMCEPCWIVDNTIFENVDGIAMIDSRPIVNNNYIYKNKRAGCVSTGLSKAKVQYNYFISNETVGCIVKDNSENVIRNNIFKDQKTHLMVDRDAIYTTFDETNFYDDSRSVIDNRTFTLFTCKII